MLLLEPINEASKMIKFNKIIKENIHDTSTQTTDKPSFVSWGAPEIVVVAHMWRHLNVVGVVLIPY